MIRQYIEIEVAVIVSLALHLAIIGVSTQAAWLAQMPLFRPLAKLMELVSPAKPKPKLSASAMPTLTFVELVEPEKPKAQEKPQDQVKPQDQTPRAFMETDSRQISKEQPKDAKFYSDKATVAANPNHPAPKAGDTPFLAGKETRVMSTEDVPIPVPSAQPAVPAVPKVQPVPVPQTPKAVPQQPREQPKEVAPQGIAKAPEQKPVAEQNGVMTVRPTLAQVPPEAPPTPGSAGRPGLIAAREIGALKSKLDASGASRVGVAAFNVAASPFGEYDKKIVKAVQSRWYGLIDRYGIYERTGMVTIHFLLYDDGTVHDLGAEENSAGEILRLFCEKAILESAPFDPLPDELRRLVGKEPRDVNFTFYY